MKKKKAYEEQIIEYYGEAPYYATDGSACFDLRLVEETEFKPYRVTIAQLATRIILPEGHVMLTFPRSSMLAKHGLLIQIGVIDEDYQKASHVVCYNVNQDKITLAAGTRVAQGLIAPKTRWQFQGLLMEPPADNRHTGLGSTDDLADTERAV